MRPSHKWGDDDWIEWDDRNLGASNGKRTRLNSAEWHQEKVKSGLRNWDQEEGRRDLLGDEEIVCHTSNHCLEIHCTASRNVYTWDWSIGVEAGGYNGWAYYETKEVSHKQHSWKMFEAGLLSIEESANEEQKKQVLKFFMRIEWQFKHENRRWLLEWSEGQPVEGKMRVVN